MFISNAYARDRLSAVNLLRDDQLQCLNRNTQNDLADLCVTV